MAFSSRRQRKIFLAILLWLAMGRPAAHAIDIMQPLVYQPGLEVAGWIWSEKLDGVRGYWDGRQLLSKTGQAFRPPADFTENFPDMALEGEIWGGRGAFAKTVGVIKQNEADAGWRELKFAIFDAPQVPGGVEDRLRAARDWFDLHPSPHVFVIPLQPVKDARHLQQELEKIEALGGEGIIVRKPLSPYTVGRSPDILKVKSHADAEAVVLAHLPGEGRNAGRLGTLLVELPGRPVRFRIGSGFSDSERESPPAIGSLITFKYYGFHPSGIPKFPSFLRVRELPGY